MKSNRSAPVCDGFSLSRVARRRNINLVYVSNDLLHKYFMCALDAERGAEAALTVSHDLPEVYSRSALTFYLDTLRSLDVVAIADNG